MKELDNPEPKITLQILEGDKELAEYVQESLKKVLCLETEIITNTNKIYFQN